jgi:hypothetical protein
LILDRHWAKPSFSVWTSRSFSMVDLGEDAVRNFPFRCEQLLAERVHGEMAAEKMAAAWLAAIGVQPGVGDRFGAGLRAIAGEPGRESI